MKHVFKFIGLSYVIAHSAVCLNLMGQDAPAAAKASAPKIQFSETTFNFGKVQPTNALRHDFIVTNVGTALLEITAVQPGCGCTTAGAWDKQIEPGKTGKIPIQFNPANFAGPVSKAVTVTCNDPAQATHYLQIQATIWRPIDIQPQYVHFMPIDGEETNETKVVRITNNLDEPVTLETPRSATPVFKTELKTVRPGKEFELHITYAGPVSNAPMQGNITVNTSAAGSQPLSVTAFAMPQPALVAMPQVVQLPVGPFNAGFQYPVSIRNNSHSLIKLSEPSVNAEGVTVNLQEVEQGKNFRLNLSVSSNFQARANQMMELSVKTTNPKHPVFKIPVTQAASPPTPIVGPVIPTAGKK
jgi:hypothetical protein